MSEKKKERILNAASECFAKYGYQKTTLKDIGQKIGLDKATIYYYFKNKEEIFTTIVLDEFHRFYLELNEVIEEKMDCIEKIYMFFEKRFVFINESMGYQQISEMEPKKLELLIESGQEILLKAQAEEEEFVAKILKKCIESGEIKDCDVGKISKYLFGLVRGIKHGIEGASTFKKFTEDELNLKLQDVKTALKIFINGLK
jgi:AcrR family transcriptional regulator